jgi:hypothetical protein
MKGPEARDGPTKKRTPRAETVALDKPNQETASGSASHGRARQRSISILRLRAGLFVLRPLLRVASVIGWQELAFDLQADACRLELELNDLLERRRERERSGR